MYYLQSIVFHEMNCGGGFTLNSTNRSCYGQLVWDFRLPMKGHFSVFELERFTVNKHYSCILMSVCHKI